MKSYVAVWEISNLFLSSYYPNQKCESQVQFVDQKKKKFVCSDHLIIHVVFNARIS